MTLVNSMVAGALGGAAGAFSMEVFQLILRRISPEAKLWVDTETDSTHHPQTAERKLLEKTTGGNLPSTAQAAQAISKTVTINTGSGNKLAFGSELVHYATGMVPGALYGVWCGLNPFNYLRGAAFGLLVFGVLNQTIVPMLGFSSRTDTSRWRNRKYSLAAHVLYGVTTEAIRRLAIYFVERQH